MGAKKKAKDPAKFAVSDEAIYAAVSARRAGFDQMAWQVPIISLTAQAFLFTIALSPDSTSWARYIASTLSIVVTLLSVHLMARHRQADISDAKWLAEIEADREVDREMLAHGQPWRDRRDQEEILKGTPLNLLKRRTVFAVWQIGLILFGFASILIIVLTMVAPGLLEGDIGNPGGGR